jgi:hypothetical protein
MVHGMIADLMPLIMNASHQIGVQVGPVTGDKESRVDVVLCQDI